MKISGFTFVRNGQILGYPFVPSIRSLLPLCDEIVVNVPRSSDDTLAMVKAIGDPKIRIIESEWNDTEKSGDPIFRRHTDLALEQCVGDLDLPLPQSAHPFSAKLLLGRPSPDRQALRWPLPGRAQELPPHINRNRANLVVTQQCVTR